MSINLPLIKSYVPKKWKNLDFYPRLTFNFLEYFNNFNLKNSSLLELGSGDSTIYFSTKFKNVISYENDKYWFKYVKNNINYKNIKNIKIKLFKKDILLKKSFFNDFKKSEYVLIDNDPLFFDRDFFCLFSIINYNTNQKIILDNCDCNITAYNLLKKHFKFKEFKGINKIKNTTITSIFYK